MVALPWLMQQAGADRPRYVPSTVADRITGLNTVNAITAALFFRERSGKGQEIEVPMFESLAQFVLGEHMGGETFEPAMGAMGQSRLLAPHRNPYATKDGYLCLLIYNDKQWRNFFRLLGREETLDTDARFSTLTSRSQNIAEIYAFVAAELKTRTSAEWLAALSAADIPVMPLNSLGDLLNDPHLNQTGFISTVEHPTEGRVRTMRVPSHWSESPPGEPRFAPRLGEHSVELLREAGYADAEIDAMLAAGVTKTA
jgi:crotonobetainyl-CoA:carnitine CoA-transferase CaiB-like acyl-CoA transferase